MIVDKYIFIDLDFKFSNVGDVQKKSLWLMIRSNDYYIHVN